MLKRSIAKLVCMIGLTAAATAGGSSEVTVETQIAAAGVHSTVTVLPGEHYLHRLKVMPLVSVKNAPQMVVWVETIDGEFLETLFITKRIARAEWRKAPGDATPPEEIRRAEALPVWAHRHGVVYADGLPVPTSEDPMPDAITSATPKKGFAIRTRLPENRRKLVVFFEVNASTDFNAAFPHDAAVGAENYSGGEWGSGQPSLVYRAVIDPAAQGEVPLVLAGHGSADGSSGEIEVDLSGITTARAIVESVTITTAESGS